MSWQGEYARRFNERVAIERPDAPPIPTVMTDAEFERYVADMPPIMEQYMRMVRTWLAQVRSTPFGRTYAPLPVGLEKRS